MRTFESLRRSSAAANATDAVEKGKVANKHG